MYSCCNAVYDNKPSIHATQPTIVHYTVSADLALVQDLGAGSKVTPGQARKAA